MNKIEEKINEKLSLTPLTREMLTSEEMEKLRNEAIAELNGDAILDGVLHSIPIYERISQHRNK